MDSLFEFYPANLLTAKTPRGLISIPHSGLKIPPQYQSCFTTNKKELNRDVDLSVHKCLDIPLLQSNGIHIIKYNFHRVFMDLNRSKDIAFLNWKKNTHEYTVIEKMSIEQERDIITQKYWEPYFFIIQQMIENSAMPFPIIDLHSMPSKPTNFHLKKNPNQGNIRPDFCLSDLNGKSCPPDFITRAAQIIREYYPNTQINIPYSGGYITQHFSNFSNPNIQIEINRALYMDEERQEVLEKEQKILMKHLTQSLLRLFTNS